VEAQDLTTALTAGDRRGFTFPWVYTRRALAEKWGIPPWEVDRVPWCEVVLELTLSKCEAEARQRRKERGL
jgi:hypothetical protein